MSFLLEIENSKLESLNFHTLNELRDILIYNFHSLLRPQHSGSIQSNCNIIHVCRLRHSKIFTVSSEHHLCYRLQYPCYDIRARNSRGPWGHWPPDFPKGPPVFEVGGPNGPLNSSSLLHIKYVFRPPDFYLGPHVLKSGGPNGPRKKYSS